MTLQSPFSKRYGYKTEPRGAAVTVRDDAPEHLREYVLSELARLDPTRHDAAQAVFQALNYTIPPPPFTLEAHALLSYTRRAVRDCDWFLIYDLIEGISNNFLLFFRRGDSDGRKYFEAAMNQFFRNHGIGWQLLGGRIVTRGEEAFESSVKNAKSDLEAAGRPTAARRIHEALEDLSRRPEADYAGAISHAINALECISGDIAGDDKATLADLLKDQNLFPGSLKKTFEGVWAYACNEGARHGKEGKDPGRDESELIVGLSALMATYLNRKHAHRDRTMTCQRERHNVS